MQLSYHGAKYTFVDPGVETIETDITCQFMGQKTKMRVAKRLPASRATNQLKYRGRTYIA